MTDAARPRPVAAAEIPAAASALAAGFFEDPCMVHCLPDAGRRFQQLRDLFAVILEHGAVPDGSAWCDSDIRCVALWTVPGGKEAADQRVAAHGDAFAEILGADLERMQRLEEAMAEVHPTVEHWYLGAIATDPAWQGKGLGTAVAGMVLERCDSDGVPAYLESSNPRNVPLYARLGFEVTGEIRPWGDAGPHLTPMWREPRPQH